jgi:hypothetical protein
MKENRYYQLVDSVTVNPDEYSKPIRFYVDIDGVFLPFSSKDNSSYTATSIFLKEDNNVHPPIEENEQMTFRYNSYVAEKFSEWSYHDKIDFVWLTAWRHQAPAALDPAFNIHSLGFLPWEKKLSDYNQAFKSIALREDQEQYPSHFVWIDDVANIRREYDEKPFFDPEENGFHTPIPSDRYMSITTDSYEGLTLPQIERIDNWVNQV